jgi:multiple sugar transport system permease protein
MDIPKAVTQSSVPPGIEMTGLRHAQRAPGPSRAVNDIADSPGGTSVTQHGTRSPVSSRRQVGRLLTNAALLLVILIFGAPFVWVGVLAFDREVGATWPWPNDPTLDNFRTLFDDEWNIGQALENSLLVVSVTTVLAALLSALAGFGLSRLAWRWTTVAAFGLLLLYTFPLSATMVPVNDLARRMHIDNTYQGLILAQTAVVLPFLIYLMKGYFDAIPRHIQEAAEVDGASRLQAWRQVLLPLVRPGLAVVAGLAFLGAWSEVLLVSAMVLGRPMATVSLRFMTGAQSGKDVTVVAALGVLYMAPVLALFLVLRKAIASGIGSAGSGQSV